MKIMERISLVLAWIACAGMISPIAAFGEQPQSAQQVRVQDVAMTSGNFAGQLVDHQGNAISNTAVVVGQQGTKVAETVTDANGRFSVANLAGGVYHVAAADTVSVCRVWSANAAPPVATDGLLVVSNSNVVRGQCNSCNGGGGVAMGGAHAGGGGGYVVNGPVDGGYVDGGYAGGGGGGYVDGGYAGGAIVDGGACGPAYGGGAPAYYGGGGGGFGGGGIAGGGGGGVLGLISNPWFVGAVVAAAVAIPLAIDDDDDDNAS